MNFIVRNHYNEQKNMIPRSLVQLRLSRASRSGNTQAGSFEHTTAHGRWFTEARIRHNQPEETNLFYCRRVILDISKHDMRQYSIMHYVMIFAELNAHVCTVNGWHNWACVVVMGVSWLSYICNGGLGGQLNIRSTHA